MLKSVAAVAILLSAGSGAFADEAILGKWRAPGGGIVRVEPCGGAYCATVISGKHKGKGAGSMSGNGGEYTGTVKDPRDDRTYSGTATVEGDRLKLTGCALKVFCKTQVWVRT